MHAKLVGGAKWAAVFAFVIAAAWLVNWNEHDSPWGRETQAAKLEILKAKLCK